MLDVGAKPLAGRTETEGPVKGTADAEKGSHHGRDVRGGGRDEREPAVTQALQDLDIKEVTAKVARPLGELIAWRANHIIVIMAGCLTCVHCKLDICRAPCH